MKLEMSNIGAAAFSVPWTSKEPLDIQTEDVLKLQEKYLGGQKEHATSILFCQSFFKQYNFISLIKLCDSR